MDIRKFFGGPPGKKKEDKPKEEGQPSADLRSPPSTSTKEKTTTPRSTQPKAVVSKKAKKAAPSSPDPEFAIDVDDTSSDEDWEDDKDIKTLDDDDDGEMPSPSQKPSPPPPKKKRPAKTANPPGSQQPPSTKKPRKAPTSLKPKKPTGPLATITDKPDALEAVKLVDAAIATLPTDEASLDISFMPEGTYQQRADDDPPSHGNKSHPLGHPDCLTGKTFVISGVLDSLRRSEAEDYVKRHGGKITSAVSGKTSFLLMGSFAGRSKYNAAQSKGVRLINEDGLLTLVAASIPAIVSQVKMEDGEQEAMAIDADAVGSGSGALTTKRASTVPPPPPPQQQQESQKANNNTNQLWVEKWKPKNSSELVGNSSLVASLRYWLQDWDNIHLRGKAPSPPGTLGKGQKGADPFKKKAVLMSGPPGIGKTSSALILCKELGFTPIEVNASDTRGKADSAAVKGVGGKLANSLKELSTNVSVTKDPKTGAARNLCLIMDEVDGMSAGDRGGVADLIQTIHKSKIPIICICNDRYSQKLKSLRNHTMELDYRKPTVQQISKRLQTIAAAEGLEMNTATMEALVQSANGGDIRLILGQMQMLRLRAKSLTYDQVKTGGMGTAKDLELSPFEAARRLLSPEANELSLADQMELVFQDHDLVPLLVQENYVNHKPRIAGNDLQRLQVLAKAADGFSAGDAVNRRVRQYQDWSLLPFAVAMGTVYPAAYVRGSREIFGLYPTEMNFPRFSAWLGQNSSGNKQKRLLGELHTRMLSSSNLECDRTALRVGYLPILRNTLPAPLVSQGKEGIPAVLDLMNNYCIAREDIDFINDVTKFKSQGAWNDDPMKRVETQVKSAFTRAFNQQHIKPKTGFGLEDAKKKRKGGGNGGGGRGAVVEEEEEEEEDGEGDGLGVEGGGAGVKKEEEEEEEEEIDPVMVRQKVMGMKHSGMQVTLKDGSAAPMRGGKGGGRGGRGRGRGKK
jgi:replication factor C subunit 1